MQNLSDWITRVSYYIGDPNNTRFSTAEVALALNDAAIEVWELMIDNNRYYYYATYDISTVASTWSYALPPDFERALILEDREGANADDHGIDIESAPPESRVGSTHWDIRGENLYLHNCPTSTVSNKYRLYYVRRPAEMSYGTATAGAATTITLMGTATYGTTSNQDDYYNNSRILYVSGPGAGTIATISDYDGGTKVATVGTGPGTTTTTVYSILSDIPDAGAQLVCVKATLTLLSVHESPNYMVWDKAERRLRRRFVRRMVMRDGTSQPMMRLIGW